MIRQGQPQARQLQPQSGQFQTKSEPREQPSKEPRLVNLLKGCGLKATPQRLSVLFSLDKHTHPSIDELYLDLKTAHPSISLATVYKNLSTLIEQGIVAEIKVPGQKARYDIFDEPHIHVVCDICGSVCDVFDEDAKMADYLRKLEKSTGCKMNRLRVVAHCCGCKHCT